jgi:uncharacterized protein involved in outer membrane biogenesis
VLLRRILVVIAGLLCLALAALVIAPPLLAPERARDLTEAALRRAIGRPIVVAGPVTLSLLPIPSLTAHKVAIANPEGAREADMLRADAVELRLAVAPLLGGRLVLQQATLTAPVIDLERLPDGALNWSLSGRAADEGAEIRGPADIAVARLRIADGTLIVHAAGQTARFVQLELDASAREATGPFRATGRGTLAGRRLSFDIELGRLAERVPLHLTLAQPDIAANAEFTGEFVAGPDAAPSLAGKLKVSGDVRGMTGQLAGDALSGFSGRFTATADLDADEAMLRLDHGDLALAGSSGTFALRLKPASPFEASLSLSLNQLDLDHGPAPAAAPKTARSPSDGEAPPTFALPGGGHAMIDLALSALVWRGGIVRDARLQAVLANGALTITRAAAQLPGGSDLTLSGTVTAPSGPPQFSGAVEADSDNLRQLLAWLGLEMKSVPEDRLRKASLAGKFTATPDDAEISGFDLTVDATRMTGAASVALRRRLALGARVAIDRLNLDAYLPSAGTASAADAPSAATALEGFGVVLHGFDANFDATIETLTWAGQPMRGARAAGTLQNGELALRQLALADVAGASLTASGSIADLAGPARWQGRLDGSGGAVERVIRLLAPGLDPAGRITGPFTAEADLAGAGTVATRLDATIGALGGQVRVVGSRGSANDLHSAMALTVDLRHPSVAGLMRALAAGNSPAGTDPGPVALSGKLSGTPDQFRLAEATVDVGGLSVAGDLAVDRTGPRARLSGTLSFGDVALDRILAPRSLLSDDASSSATVWSRKPFETAPLGLADAALTLSGASLTYRKIHIERPALSLSLAGGAIEIGRFSGNIFGGSMTASGWSDCAGGRGSAVEASLHQIALDAAFSDWLGSSPVSGPGDLDLTLSSVGCSPAALIANLSGRASLQARDGALHGIDVAGLADHLARRAPSGEAGAEPRVLAGSTRYGSLFASLHIAGGLAQSDYLVLSGSDLTARGSLSFDLSNWRIHAELALRPPSPPAAPPVTLTVDGPPDKASVNSDLGAFEAYLASHRAVAPAP